MRIQTAPFQRALPPCRIRWNRRIPIVLSTQAQRNRARATHANWIGIATPLVPTTHQPSHRPPTPHQTQRAVCLPPTSCSNSSPAPVQPVPVAGCQPRHGLRPRRLRPRLRLRVVRLRGATQQLHGPGLLVPEPQIPAAPRGHRHFREPSRQRSSRFRGPRRSGTGLDHQRCVCEPHQSPSLSSHLV
jgi:hypothetical protein